MPQTRVALLTPAGVSAGIAAVGVWGDIDGLFARAGLRPVAVGGAALRDILGVDRGVAARPTADHLIFYPHGGELVTRRVLEGLVRLGCVGQGVDPERMYPEARSAVEARALASLAGGVSPLAVDLLLAQHDLWSVAGAASDAKRDRVLGRLLAPPLVVAAGPANIGKSTLLNALAGRQVSLVADMAGTTRDHVGALIDLAGLVVRFLDTPGIGPPRDDLDRRSQEQVRELWGAADLLLICGDPHHPPADAVEAGPSQGPEALMVCLRADLGPAPPWAEHRVSLAPGREPQGLIELCTCIRDHLVPPGLIEEPTPWRFWA